MGMVNWTTRADLAQTAEQAMISMCRGQASLHPHRVWIVARRATGSLCMLPMADLPEGAGWEVLYSTFSGACAVC